MLYKILSLSLLFLLISSLYDVFGQQIDISELRVMIPPQTGHICTLEPTDHNAHLFIGPGRELKHHMEKQLKTTDSTFEVDYRIMTDNACGATEWPQDARNAFEYAINIWSVHLRSDIPIKIDAVWRDIQSAEGSITLGSAGPTRIVQLPNVGEPGTWYTIAQLSAMSGTAIRDQIDGVNYDIIINVNCDFNEWYFGTDTSTPTNRTDFVTVVLHEIGHGIGFIGSASADNDQLTGEWGTPLGEESEDLPFIFDHFVVDGDDVHLLNEDIYPNPSLNLYHALTGQNNALYFDGVETNNALADDAINRARLYAPLPYREGSSYSHLDHSTFTNTINALMRPRIDRSMAIHTPGPVFCGMLSDMGWPLSVGCLSLIAADALITLSESRLNFGVTNVNQDIQRTITVSNGSDATDPLSGAIESTDDNFFVLGDNSFTLEPGQETTFTVQYSPEDDDQHSGTLRVIHNARNIQSPISLALTGEALDTGQIVKLEQSYPNPIVPTNPNPTIPYAISQDSNVSLDLYTVTGQHIRSLVKAHQNTGRYEIEVDMRGLSSGLYIYRIIVDDVVESGKLMLVN